MMKDEIYDIRHEVANRIDQKGLHKMMKDEDDNIRTAVARRIDQKGLHEMMADKSDAVRSEIAERIDQKYVNKMMKDESSQVRHKVADRVDQRDLYKMITDSNPGVRVHVAKRIDQKSLNEMIDDESISVRMKVAERVDQKGLQKMMKDGDDKVRSKVADRIDQKDLQKMLNDKDSHIVEAAQKRIELFAEIEPMIKSYNKTGKVVIPKRLQEDLNAIISEDRSSDHIIGLSAEFYKNIKNHKYQSFHVNSRDEWLDSSSNDLSLLLKDSIQRQFGGEIVYHAAITDYTARANQLYTTYDKKTVDEYVRVQKKLSKSHLDAMFPDTDKITIYRGTTENEATKVKGKVKVKSNPVSSWTLNESTAVQFGRGIVMKTTVSKDDIWSTFMTHANYGKEREILLIGNKDRIVEII